MDKLSYTQEKLIDMSPFDVILKAGHILMKSGAETQRVEETMRHMARALRLEDFDAYVVNRGLMASGRDAAGQRQAQVISIPETQIDLAKIEQVNALSRSLVAEPQHSLASIYRDLENIDKHQEYSLASSLFAYFFGAGSFSLALGSSLVDSLVSSFAGLLLGIAYYFLGPHIRTRFLLAIIGSFVITLFVNIAYSVGFGDSRSAMMLGALMVIVPGAFFVSSVREISESNYFVGMALLLTALLTCISISAGVAATMEILPFAEQLSALALIPSGSIGYQCFCALMAGLGTLAFGILYQVPNRHFGDIGLLSAATWLIYLLLNEWGANLALAIALPALLVAFLSRILAVVRKCPMTVFVSTSLFPLIPGLTLYKGVYFMLTGDSSLAFVYFKTCFISAFAIAVAIASIQQIPNTCINRLSAKIRGL